MGFIIGLLLVGALVMGMLYIMQFYIDLDGDKENIIKDGLIKELMAKAVADPDPDSFIIDVNAQTITMGRTIVKKDGSGLFWFPYYVKVRGKEYNQRQTQEDWGYDVGYVTRFSKDYYIIRDLLKKSKTNIEQTQREKLNLNK
jgi:hypothetical protein